MNTTNTVQQPSVNEAMSTIDALWTLIATQPKKVRKALAVRLQEELAVPARKKTLKAIKDAKEKRDVTVCASFEDYLKAVAE